MYVLHDWDTNPYSDHSFQNQPKVGLVNGSLGKVLEFITIREARERHLDIGEINAGDAARVISSHSGHEFKKNDLFPLVEFLNGSICNKLLCAPTDFTVENLKGGVEARRIQVPLALSYAMSIHKSQGQTLSRVKVDLSCVFERGQGVHAATVTEPALSAYFSLRCSIESNQYGRSSSFKF